MNRAPPWIREAEPGGANGLNTDLEKLARPHHLCRTFL